MTERQRKTDPQPTDQPVGEGESGSFPAPQTPAAGGSSPESHTPNPEPEGKDPDESGKSPDEPRSTRG
jgi:hypothetical protein